MRNWIFILIFSTLLGNMNAHQIQLVTYHQKTNGVLIRVVVSNVPEVDNIAAWVGQENWFYLTLNEAVFAENVLENLKAKPPLLEIEGIQNQESVQIGFLMEHFISDFEIFHSPSNRVFLIHIWHELDGGSIADIKNSENKNKNKIFSLSAQDSKSKPFYESFVDAREKYGPEKYFVWYDNWYSTEDKTDVDHKATKDSLDIWEKHWSGTQENLSGVFGPSLPKLKMLNENGTKELTFNSYPFIEKPERQEIVKERVSQEDCNNSFILDGFPRTIPQAEGLDLILNESKKKIDLVIDITVDEATIIERITGRFSCDNCGTGFHEKFKKPKIVGVCDECGSEKFSRRKDDNYETVKKRFDTYNQETAPLLPFYKEKNILLKIDGMNNIEEVFNELKKLISSKELLT